MTDKEMLAKAIIKNEWFKRGKFLLSSGKESDFYIDLRPCMCSTKHIHLLTGPLVTCLVNEVKLKSGDLLCGVITSGLYLAGAMVQRLSTTAIDTSAIYCRTEHRKHGIKRNIEGEYRLYQDVIVIDDVATSGRSLVKVIEILVESGLRVKACLVVVDREEGAKELLTGFDVPLFSILNIGNLTI